MPFRQYPRSLTTSRAINLTISIYINSSLNLVVHSNVYAGIREVHERSREVHGCPMSMEGPREVHGGSWEVCRRSTGGTWAVHGRSMDHGRSTGRGQVSWILTRASTKKVIQNRIIATNHFFCQK